MIKVLIVDDEHHVVSWLRTMFESIETLELDLYSAYSGEQALEVLNSVKIDVVFSDIRMPGMSGFDLVDRIMEKWPSSRVVFLTGYDEFEYAYRANGYDCVSYLLKTEDDEKIIEALKKAVDSIQQEYHNNLMVSRAQAAEKMVDYLHERELVHVIHSDTYSPDDVARVIEESQLDFAADQPFYFLLAAPCGMQTSEIDIAGIRGLTNVYLKRYAECCCVRRNQELVWLLQPHPGQKKALEEILETFLTVCKETMELDLFLLWYQQSVELPYLGSALHRLMDVLHEQVVLTDHEAAVFVLTTEQETAMRQAENEAVHEENVQVRILQMEHALIVGRKSQFWPLFESLTSEIPDTKGMHSLPVIELFQSISLVLLRQIRRRGTVPQEALSRLYMPGSFACWGDAKQCLRDIAKGMFTETEDCAQSNALFLIGEIKSFVEKNMEMPMSLDAVSKHVNYNASYISRVFRRETGEMLSEYITRVKLQRAKELLAQTAIPVQEIARKVGIDSARYFSTLFKKSEGITPGDYRLKYQN